MQATQPFLVYRDRIGVPSEIGFLRRQYIGFTKLHPVWTGRTLLPGASRIGDHLLHLGGDGPLGPIHRWLFRYLERLPPMSDRNFAPLLHAQFARGGALALSLAEGLGSRMVVTLHGGDVSKTKNWRGGTVLAKRWPAVVQKTERFVCVSGAVAEIAAARGVPLRKLVVLPIGVEVPDNPPISHPTGYLFVGRFVEKKGIAVLADAMRRLRALGDQTPLVCAGDGPLRSFLEALVREVPGITLTGWLSPEAVREHMIRAFAVVVPSIVAGDGDAEGLPSVIPEAMAQGCPVVGSDQGGIAEAVRHGHTGLLVPAGDAGALADAMHRIVQDGALRKTLGSAGFKHAATCLNARNQSQKLETLLLSV
ncbi:MAG: colanic acid/amylovoran biosynthesis glycosyltransferase [Acetobacteraceae bacterium]|nr:colanic acid/amylovoran biosynthesis glycosyltransferase [Acetobacteraceae bacterium]